MSVIRTRPPEIFYLASRISIGYSLGLLLLSYMGTAMKSGSSSSGYSPGLETPAALPVAANGCSPSLCIRTDLVLRPSIVLRGFILGENF